VETIDEKESKFEKESISSRTGRDQIPSSTVPPTATDPTNVNIHYFFVCHSQNYLPNNI
jgi:hypothetical protein